MLSSWLKGSHRGSFAKPSSGCTGISNASVKAPLLLLSLGVTLVPSSVDSPSWLQLTPYFLSHTHLSVKSLDVQAFLGRVHHKMFYGKKEFSAEWLISLWGCLSHLYLQMHVAICNGVDVLGGGPWGLCCQDA